MEMTIKFYQGQAVKHFQQAARYKIHTHKSVTLLDKNSKGTGNKIREHLSQYPLKTNKQTNKRLARSGPLEAFRKHKRPFLMTCWRTGEKGASGYRLLP